MSLETLVEIIHSPPMDNWAERHREAFECLFGSRYPKNARTHLDLRAPDPKNMKAPFAAYIRSGNPGSGPYAGLSFVMFPETDAKPCLFGLVVGTNGLGEDHVVLSRPGHARKVQAICSWLNAQYGRGELVAWSKQDPTRLDIDAAAELSGTWGGFQEAFAQYGRFMYGLFHPSDDREATAAAVGAMLDLLMDEKVASPLQPMQDDAARLRAGWFDHLMPAVEEADVLRVLKQRRYVILQGPPGTGKTRMATLLKDGAYGGRGESIQFHPNTTYESFIGGLAPVTDKQELGLRFAPAPGALLRAAMKAAEDPERDYLLHIDEINRADLGKVLGEAIYLLEAQADTPREVRLPFDFPGIRQPFRLPANLHILGTMNSADRSIALVDIAVRRRFGFLSMWPRSAVVMEHGGGFAQEAFRRLFSVFVEYAPSDAFALVPGHSYFLEKDPAVAAESLRINLVPLLEEYLAQGYVSGFSDSLRSYLQWLEAARPE